MPSNKKILVLPHVGKGGGAGIYNSDLINALKKISTVEVSGVFANEYGVTENSLYANLFNYKLIFPNYDGVSFIGKTYWLFFIIYSTFCIKKHKSRLLTSLVSIEIVFFTSSIQIPFAYLLKKIGYRGEIYCVIQENLKLEGVWGLLVKYWINSVDCIVGITKEWCDYAASNNIETELLLNRFQTTKQECNIVPEFDALYVGGESQLKGINEVIKLFNNIANIRPVKILLLGKYSHDFESKINGINRSIKKQGSKIVVGGYVASIDSYLAKSKFLILPIKAPHFCRPAIEAGFCERTFLIPDFHELSEFAKDNYNCLTFQSESSKDFNEKFIYLLDNPSECSRLGKNNKAFAFSNYQGNDFDIVLSNILS